MKPKTIYLDHAATTPIDERVAKLILKSTKDLFANPGGLYDEAILAKKALEKARKDTADILSALPDEIIFTSGGTESDNLALFGVVRKAMEDFPKKKMHIIVSLIEHAAILEVAQELEKEGVLVSYATPDKDGIISPKTIESLLKTNTVLVSVMHANNEIGTVQPIREIAKVVRHFRKNNKMIFIYVIKSQNRKFRYVGITDNLERRLKEHKSKKSFYTKQFSDIKLVYSEKVKNKTTAEKREKQIKGGSREKKLRLSFRGEF